MHPRDQILSFPRVGKITNEVSSYPWIFSRTQTLRLCHVARSRCDSITNKTNVCQELGELGPVQNTKKNPSESSSTPRNPTRKQIFWRLLRPAIEKSHSGCPQTAWCTIKCVAQKQNEFNNKIQSLKGTIFYLYLYFNLKRSLQETQIYVHSNLRNCLSTTFQYGHVASGGALALEPAARHGICGQPEIFPFLCCNMFWPCGFTLEQVDLFS